MTNKLLLAFGLALSLSLSPLLSLGTAQAATSLWVRITSVATFSDGTSQIFVGADLPTSCTDKRSFRVANEAMARQVIGSMLAKREIRVNTSNSCTGSLDNVTWFQTR
jgi:hypothetical protein